MKFTTLTRVNYKSCQHLWRLRRSTELPQWTRINRFIQQHQVSSICYIAPGQPAQSHDMHVVTVNTDTIELNDLCNTVQMVAAQSRRYLWISVNKFLVYSIKSQSLHREENDLDLRLIKVLEDQLPQWQVLDRYYQSEDHGDLGNFEYPITALVLRRI